MAITDKEAIENYLLISIDPSFDDQLDEWIAAVESSMNKETDRILLAGATPADYYYDVDKCSSNTIRIDEFTSITEVRDVDSDTVIDSDDLYMYPSNAAYINKIEYPDTGFTVGKRKIKVTGIRGRYTSETLPADLKHAATVLVSEIIEFSNPSAISAVKKETIGRYSVEYTVADQQSDIERAKKTLRSYRRMR